jgi:GNAT superfamily N-acetyltransferase
VCRAAAMWGDRMEGMALDPLRGHEPAIAGLTLRRVESAADLRRFDQVMVAAFGGPWAAPDLLETRGLLDAPAMTHYLGIYNGRPVATATRLLCEGLAGVFNVGVVPEVRGRGIGTAITWRAALEGRDEGATASFLQASRMGAPIYRRMGYQTVSSYTIWFGPPLSLRGG